MHEHSGLPPSPLHSMAEIHTQQTDTASHVCPSTHVAAQSNKYSVPTSCDLLDFTTTQPLWHQRHEDKNNFKYKWVDVVVWRC